MMTADAETLGEGIVPAGFNWDHSKVSMSN